jgi:hypothetical protein
MIASLQTRLRVVVACLSVVSAVLNPVVSGAQSSPDTSTSPPHQAAGPPPIVTARRTFYVLVDPASDRQSASLVTMATAAELNKAFKVSDDPTTANGLAWAVPEPSWKPSDFAQQCHDDPNAIGAVILSYFAGDASHFWLLWQTQTTTFELAAQIMSCNQPAAPATASSPAPLPTTASAPAPVPTMAAAKPGAANPEIVAVISTLHGSKGTPWVERRTDASVPLLSGVALVALFTHQASKSEPTNVLTVATIGTAVLGQSFNKDIPGYSQPVRYRLDAHHVGTDVVAELRFLCGQPETQLSTGGPDFASLCTTFNWAAR